VSAEQRRVPLAEVGDFVAPGQPLPFKLVDPVGRLLLAAGQVIANPRQLAALLERGACVEYPDLVAARQARAGSAAAPAPLVRQRTLFDRWEQQIGLLDALLRRLGSEPQMQASIEAFADEHIALVDREADVALFICMRQDERRFALYGLTHALYTATVALLAARVLGWPPERARLAVLAALTMNVSIAELQARMAEQADPPTKKQLDQIRAHPQRSAGMLRASGVGDPAWLAAVEDHHERPGGGGYPRALHEVDLLARLVRAADAFMAKVSPRAIRAHLTPPVAARQLFQEEAGGPIAAALIKAIGIYPPGDFVRLRNGDAAMIVRRAAGAAAPSALALQDAKGRPLAGAPRRDTGLPEFAIAGPLNERAGLPRVLPEQVYGLLEP